MTNRLLIVLGMVVSLLVASRAAAEVPRELKAKLFERYDQKNLRPLKTGIRVTLRGLLPYTAIHYHHFHPAVPKDAWPKQFSRQNLLDEYTTEEVEGPATHNPALSPGEMIRVRKFYVAEADRSEAKAFRGFTGRPLFVEFYLVGLSATLVGSDVFGRKADYECHFRFVFPPAGPDVDATFSDIVQEIGRYLIPTEEYEQAMRAVKEQIQSLRNVPIAPTGLPQVPPTNSPRNITIQPGMSKEDVIGVMGEPLRSVVFGKKTILSYPDLTIELEGNKVVDVRAN